MIYVDSKVIENRICKIIMSTVFKKNFQIQGHETWVSKKECAKS